ncbi:MAG: sigma-70 family RNA polymerase sigma factor [Thermoguttaceae bacterium]
MADETGEIDVVLRCYRGYLRILADLRLDPRLRGKLDPSDIVQESMIQAYKAWDQCRGASDGERLAWLKMIVTRNVLHALRDFRRAKRDICKEFSLEEVVGASSARLERWLSAEQSTPSRRAEEAEKLLQIAGAVDSLPDGQRDAVVLYYWQGCSLAEISESLGRSVSAVAGLLHRGVKRLREHFADSE